MFSKKTYRDTRWMERIIEHACYPMDPDLQFNVASQLYANWHTIRDDFDVSLPYFQSKYPCGKLVRIKNGECQCMVDGSIITVTKGGIVVEQKEKVKV